MQDKWIKAKTASEICKVSKTTILKWVKEGILEGHQPMKKNSTFYINYYSIPTYLRENYELRQKE